MKSLKPIKLIFNPIENKENQYIHILVDFLSENGFQVEKLDDLFKSWSHFQSIRLVHLNWFENLDDTSTRKMWISYFRKLVVLAAIRLSNKKLVWTMHNRLTHEKRSSKLSQRLTQKLVKQADAIVIHSAVSESILKQSYSSISGKIVHIPHPNFIDIYPTSVLNQKSSGDEKLQLLFVGAVKPYKNIELLIEVASTFPEEIHLKIAGNASSKSYREELMESVKGKPNIELKLEFIPDEELPVLIQQSDLLILPYSMESSLNSGTVILAFSYGRSVICPRIGTIDDLKEGEADFFSYHYVNEADHLQAINIKIVEAIALKKKDPNSLHEMGERLLELVSKKNNKKSVGENLIQLYHQLLTSKSTF